jgi:hypothetical protein
MDCSTCKYPVLADWSKCRRCGAPLRVPIVAAKIPGRTALQGRQTFGATGGVATSVAPAPAPAPAPLPNVSPAARAAAYLANAPADTLLPGAFSRPDNLLPRATRAAAATEVPVAPSAPAPPATARPAARTVPVVGARVARERAAREHWRRAIATAVVAVALAASVIAVWPVVFTSGGTVALAPPPAFNEQRATDLLRTVLGGARHAYAANHGYASLSPASLSARAYNVPVVGSSAVAGGGAVSLRVDDAAVLTLASPADARRCVFARDDAAHDSTVFVTVSTSNCRAAAAPDTGWRTR